MTLSDIIVKASATALRYHQGAHRRVLRILRPDPASKASAPYRLKVGPSSSPLKIFHVNGNFAVGGTTQLIVDLIEHLSDEYAHEIFVPAAPDPLPYQPVTLREFDLSNLTALRAYFEEHKPALVHVQYWVRKGDEYVGTALWYASIFRICADLDIPVLQNVNVPTCPFVSPSVVHNAYVSEFVRRTFGSDDVESSVVYPGSDFSHFANPHPEQLPGDAIGMVYRLDHDKLNERSIEPFIEVVKRRPATRCLIVGGGRFLELYRKRVSDERLEENFEFTGFVSYAVLPELFGRFGIFVTPVHDESFGQVTPFAMSMGLAVAGYDVGALSEILGGSETLVAGGDVGSLADTIIDVLDDPVRRLSLGRANQHRSHAHFSVNEMIEAYRTLYRRHAVNHADLLKAV